VTPIGRRKFLETAGTVAAWVLAASCGAGRHDSPGPEDPETMARRHGRGRLKARPGGPPTRPAGAGLEPLRIGSERDGVIYAPPGYDPSRPAPLVLTLHGAGGSARRGLPRLQSLADEHGLLLLAADSRGRTWDTVLGGFGPDVGFIDEALGLVFARYAVDPGRIAAEGFSDGASYALGLALANGDLFTHAIAFSPGFLPGGDDTGVPRVFISHGTADSILPIDQCSRRIVRELERRHYPVRYVEFEGDHEVPPAIARQALDWLLAPTA
jgi:predicted esterase